MVSVCHTSVGRGSDGVLHRGGLDAQGLNSPSKPGSKSYRDRHQHRKTPAREKKQKKKTDRYLNMLILLCSPIRLPLLRARFFSCAGHHRLARVTV